MTWCKNICSLCLLYLLHIQFYTGVLWMVYHLAIGTWVPSKNNHKSLGDVVIYKRKHFCTSQIWGSAIGWCSRGGGGEGEKRVVRVGRSQALLALLHVFVILLGALDQPAYLLLTCTAEVQKGRSSIASVFQAGRICVIFYQ